MRKKKRFPIAVIITGVLLIAVAAWGWSIWARVYHAAPPDPTNPDDPNFSEQDPEKNILNILILGIDQVKNEPARADSIMVMSINQDTGEVALISIPRDARVEIPGRGMDKINHAMAYKGELRLMISTVEKLLGVQMHHYVYTNFSGFTNIVNTLGGVMIDVKKDMYHVGPSYPINLKAGLQRLNGEQALGYVRYRGDSNGDFARMQRQQEFLKAVATETLQLNKLVRAPKLLEQVARYIRTDMTIPQVLSFSRLASDVSLDTVPTIALRGKNTSVNGVSYVALDGDHLKETISRYLLWEEQKEEEEEQTKSASQ